MNSSPAAPSLEGTISKPAEGWDASDLPCEPGAVLQYRTLHGSRVLAVLADHSLWRVQSISARGEVLQWSWTPGALAGNLWETESYEIVPGP
jgi:hypothetical protein